MNHTELEVGIRDLANTNLEITLEALAFHYDIEYDPADVRRYIAIARGDVINVNGADEHTYMHVFGTTEQGAVDELATEHLRLGLIPKIVWDLYTGLAWPVIWSAPQNAPATAPKTFVVGHRRALEGDTDQVTRTTRTSSQAGLMGGKLYQPRAAKGSTVVPLSRQTVEGRIADLLDRAEAAGYDVDVAVDNAVEAQRRRQQERLAAAQEEATSDA